MTITTVGEHAPRQLRGMSFKTEYLYSEFSGLAFVYQGTESSFTSGRTIQGVLDTGRLGIHTVRVGLNWKLGDTR